MSSSSQVYLAVIADIVASCSLGDRALHQEQLEDLLRRLNNLCRPYIAADFIVTIGDEFQGLLTQPAALTTIWQTIDAAALPFQLRLAIGCGELSTALKPQAIGMDGPVFHRARQSLDTLKATGGFLAFSVGDRRCDLSLNTIAMLRDALLDSWTKQQKHLYGHFRRVATQRQLAEEMHVSPAAISRMLARMKTRQLLACERNMVEILHDWMSDAAGECC